MATVGRYPPRAAPASNRTRLARASGNSRLTVSNEEARLAVARGRRNGSAVARKLATPDADNAPTAEMPAVTESDDQTRARSIPEAAVARLAVYLRVLSAMAEQGATTVASEELAAAAGVN